VKTLLLVEDGEVETFLVQRALDRIGSPCSFQVVKNGDQAIDYLAGLGQYADRQAYPLPAVILLDLVMPGRNGHQVLQWIRAQPGLKALPVIIFTSSVQVEDAKAAYGSGANDYCLKPDNVEGLRQILARIAKKWLEPDAPAPQSAPARPPSP